MLLGKLLRIRDDGTIPDSNPFVGLAGRDEIWAYGLRNPWRCAFDQITGDLYIADVGQLKWEEIDWQPAASSGGENYGWLCLEGNHCTIDCGTEPDCDCPSVPPIHEYPHTEGCSITGGEVYHGCAIPDLAGTYFFADFCSDERRPRQVMGTPRGNINVHIQNRASPADRAEECRQKKRERRT